MLIKPHISTRYDNQFSAIRKEPILIGLDELLVQKNCYSSGAVIVLLYNLTRPTISHSGTIA